MSKYDACDITNWPITAPEYGGDDGKNWVGRPELADPSEKSQWWLFKPAKYGLMTLPGSVPGARYRRRDDHVEKIVSELADLIGLPAADVEVAVRDGEEGIISRNVAPKGWDLQPGNTYLSEFDGYLNCDVNDRPRNRVGHNVTNISKLLQGKPGPPDTAVAEWEALDVFVGYLILDAWVANTDRHALNWGLLDSNGAARLAKSYDHGSSLASGASETRLRQILESGVEGWSQRALAHRFEDGKKKTLLDVAWEGLQLSSGRAKEFVDRIGSLDRASWLGVLEGIPSMSEVAYTFADELLAANRKRLCDGNKRLE
ncbi:HipA domain-containing protein [Arthrobacter sp. SIMBA_036]|uniref:HipA domain-containing protein n=1 Tax=Arthrobacter sp. SIMBA_036 TaxID=3085778 RepID=UPI00397C3239